MPSKADIRKRAIRGALLLDAKEPGWFRKVDLETLDIWSDDHCVLGQVFGSGNAGRAILWPGTALNIFWRDRNRNPIAHGFITDAWPPEIVYATLQEQFVLEITSRMEAQDA